MVDPKCPEVRESQGIAARRLILDEAVVFALVAPTVSLDWHSRNADGAAAGFDSLGAWTMINMGGRGCLER